MATAAATGSPVGVKTQPRAFPARDVTMGIGRRCSFRLCFANSREKLCELALGVCIHAWLLNSFAQVADRVLFTSQEGGWSEERREREAEGGAGGTERWGRGRDGERGGEGGQFSDQQQ